MLPDATKRGTIHNEQIQWFIKQLEPFHLKLIKPWLKSITILLNFWSYGIDKTFYAILREYSTRHHRH